MVKYEDISSENPSTGYFSRQLTFKADSSENFTNSDISLP